MYIKFIENTMKNWGIELTAEGRKLCWSENPERHLQGRCAITICDSDDATELYT